MGEVAIGRPAAPAAPVVPAWTRPALLFGGGFALLFALVVIHVSQGSASLTAGTIYDAIVRPDGSLDHQIVRYVRLPRVAAGVVAGAALGVAGALMQAVTRNPLSSPSTLGVNAGATLAVVATTIFAPGLTSWSPAMAPLAGGAVAASIVYLLAGGHRATPARLALAGMAMTLALAAATGALQLLHEQQLGGLFFWGSGALLQNDWSGVRYGLPRVGGAIAVAILLGRALEVLGLGDDTARSLGQRTQLLRGGAFALAIFLAATAVAVTGPIGFVGIVAPHLVRLLGIRRHRPLFAGAALWGAIVVVGADVAGRIIGGRQEIPAGIVTAMVGAPWFIWLARRERASTNPRGLASSFGPTGRVRLPFPLVMTAGLLALGLALVAGLMLGDLRVSLVDAVRGGDRTAEMAHRVVFDARLPRLLVAGVAGACLGVAGGMIQGVARNPLAAPELVGVTTGAGLAALIALLAFPGVPVALVPAIAFAGALLAFGLTYAMAWRGGLSPTRLALVGIAVAALCSAGINLLVLRASVRVATALVWLSGSTYARNWDDFRQLLPWAVVLLPAALLMARWLDLLALGDDLPRGLGLRLERARALLLLTAVALSAAAVSIVGTVGFVGMIAPHAARLLAGGVHRRLLPVAGLLGALVLVVADTVGRTALAPREIPSGLVTALLGTPYFLLLLWRAPRAT